MALAADQRTAPTARSLAFTVLTQISTINYDLWLNNEIKRFIEDPKVIPLPRPIEAPPGMPIGDEESRLW
jgi:hypothetical protein